MVDKGEYCCETCKDTGETGEDHGGGAVEVLGCLMCYGQGPLEARIRVLELEAVEGRTKMVKLDQHVEELTRGIECLLDILGASPFDGVIVSIHAPIVQSVLEKACHSLRRSIKEIRREQVEVGSGRS